jgi:hypothetical protein
LPFNVFLGWWFFLGGLLFLGDKGVYSSSSDLGWNMYGLDKNPLGFFKCEHMKRLGGFEQIGISIEANWVAYFIGFARETPM